MRATTPFVARFKRLEHLARTANDLPRNSLRDAGDLDAATVTEPVMPLVKAEVVTHESGHELVRWGFRIVDLEHRIAEQKRRVASERGEGLGSIEVLHLMEQTLENWRAHKRSLQQRL